MTTVSTNTVEAIRHEWIVPVHWRDHAVIGDVRDAIAMATKQAEASAISTVSDDWLRVRITDESIVFYYETERPTTDIEVTAPMCEQSRCIR